MKKNTKIILILALLALLLLTWAPWMDNQAIHDNVLKEKGWKDGTITSPEHFKNLSNKALQERLEDSRKKGVENNGILVCDYKVSWFPFGRVAGSCEGMYFVTFWGKILL